MTECLLSRPRLRLRRAVVATGLGLIAACGAVGPAMAQPASAPVSAPAQAPASAPAPAAAPASAPAAAAPRAAPSAAAASAPLAVAPPSASLPTPPVSCPPAPEPYTAEESEAGVQTARDRGFMFRLTRDDHESYILGTVHVGQRDWIFPGPTLVEALQNADRVVMELDLGDPAVLQRLQAGFRAGAESATLPPALAQRLARARTAQCAEGLAALRPEMQAMSLAALAMRDAGYDPAYGIDMAIAEGALSLDKPTGGLETPEQQLALLFSDDAATRAEIVAGVLDELADPRMLANARRLLEAWNESDVETIRRYPRWCNCLETPAARRRWTVLIDERNAAMVEEITRLHETGQSLFVAVGALHFAGDDGLRPRLEAAGFLVQRMLYPLQ